MTTITYRDGIMAADSSIWVDGTMNYKTRKIFKLPDGTLVGFCGTWAHCMRLLEYLKGEQEDIPTNIKEASAIVVTPKRRVIVYEGGTMTYVSRTKYLAAGSGSAVALGAMHAGATAVEAIKASIEHDNHTRGPIRSIKLED
jgi:ATP-dependent protease HslVU (ClpYQ) peptidase subunit